LEINKVEYYKNKDEPVNVSWGQMKTGLSREISLKIMVSVLINEAS
jgi:hypothetical protein